MVVQSPRTQSASLKLYQLLIKMSLCLFEKKKKKFWLPNARIDFLYVSGLMGLRIIEMKGADGFVGTSSHLHGTDLLSLFARLCHEILAKC